MQKIRRYSQVSTSLACLSNEKLKQILADGKPMHEGISSKSALISIDDIPVFVKKVPLTDLEQDPQNQGTVPDLDLRRRYQNNSTVFIWLFPNLRESQIFALSQV